jgi:hypothetical protein
MTEAFHSIQDHPFVSRLLILYCKSLQKRNDPLHVGVSLLVSKCSDSNPNSPQSMSKGIFVGLLNVRMIRFGMKINKK